jgi:hypothetical protein
LSLHGKKENYVHHRNLIIISPPLCSCSEASNKEKHQQICTSSSPSVSCDCCQESQSFIPECRHIETIDRNDRPLKRKKSVWQKQLPCTASPRRSETPPRQYHEIEQHAIKANPHPLQYEKHPPSFFEREKREKNTHLCSELEQSPPQRKRNSILRPVNCIANQSHGRRQ